MKRLESTKLISKPVFEKTISTKQVDLWKLFIQLIDLTELVNKKAADILF